MQQANCYKPGDVQNTQNLCGKHRQCIQDVITDLQALMSEVSVSSTLQWHMHIHVHAASPALKIHSHRTVRSNRFGGQRQQTMWQSGQREEEVMHSCGRPTWACALSCFLLLFSQLKPNRWLERALVGKLATPINKAELLSLFLTCDGECAASWSDLGVGRGWGGGVECWDQV